MRKLICLIIVISLLAPCVFATAEEWRCPSCGHIVTGNYCNNCGAAKTSGEWTCPSCGNSATGNFCSICGTARPSGSINSSDPSVSNETPTPAPTPRAADLADVAELINSALHHTRETVYSSSDRHHYYVRDYVGLNLSSFGYTSIGGDRLDRYGSGLLKICPIAIDGSFIDINDESALGQYIVVNQNVPPNSQLSITYMTDDNGNEYQSLVDHQSIESVDLLVARLDGSVAGPVISYLPVEILPSPDRYTTYVRNYVGKNLASVGYTSIGGDRLDQYNSAYIKLCIVSSDGTYIDIHNEDILKQYLVTGQNISPNTEIHIVHETDSDGNEYDSLVAFCSVTQIDLQIERIDGTTQYNTVNYTPVAISPSPNKYTWYIRNYVGKNFATVGYTSISGKRMDEYGDAHIELVPITPDGSAIDYGNIDELSQYVVVGQDIAPNSEMRLTYLTDFQGNEYGHLVESATYERIILTLCAIDSMPENTNPTPHSTASTNVSGPSGENGANNIIVDSTGNYEYTLLDNNTAAITKYLGSNSHCTVPATLDDHAVSRIGASVFENHTEITRLSMYANPDIIDDRAFLGCTGISTITIPNKCISIGTSAFEGCTNLKNVRLFGAPQIGTRAFFGCSVLASVEGGGLRIIGESAFECCTSLRYIYTENFATIGARAFFGCTGLQIYDCVIGAQCNCITIGESAFEGCTGISHLYVYDGNSLEIGARAFYGCTALSRIVASRTTICVGDYAFYGCTSLNTVELEGNDISYGIQSFDACPLLVDNNV